MTHPDAISLSQVEETLTGAGWHPLSPFWRDTLGRALTVPSKGEVVVRVGRRGGKSTTIARLAMAVIKSALRGDAHRMGSGDVGVITIISARTWQARERAQMIARGLDVLNIPNRPRYETIDIHDGAGDLACRVACVSATVGSVVSQSTVCAICDEVARWRNETGQNPAEEILSSLRPSLVSDPLATLWLLSSPWTTRDAHAQAFDNATSDGDPMRVYAPTWIANPTITEAETHKRSPDDREWRREYLALPMEDEEEAWFDALTVDAAMGVDP